MTQNLWGHQTRSQITSSAATGLELVGTWAMTANFPILCLRFVQLGTNQRKAKRSPNESHQMPRFSLASLQLPRGNSLKTESIPEAFLSYKASHCPPASSLRGTQARGLTPPAPAPPHKQCLCVLIWGGSLFRSKTTATRMGNRKHTFQSGVDKSKANTV